MKISKLVLSISLWFAAAAFSFGETKIRVGHFPNITHAQGVVAHALSRQGKGWFEQRLGPGTKIEWFVYNAGPSMMEAVFANSIDLTYVGPGPALNAYTKSKGEEIRLIAGAANGGAGLVVQPDENLKAAADFRGKKIATPQLGNTQDISCRAWLTAGGLKITQLGGDAQVIPTQNPDQLGLFKAKKIDGVWTVEPWLTRLEQEASGKVIVEEKDAATTVLVSRVKFLNEQRDLAKKFVQAHAELTDWIEKNPEEAQALIKACASSEFFSIQSVSSACAWTNFFARSRCSFRNLTLETNTVVAVSFSSTITFPEASCSRRVSQGSTVQTPSIFFALKRPN